MPKYKIVFLPLAAIDRDEIQEYLSQIYESTAKNFFLRLRKSTEMLKEHPYSCPAYEHNSKFRKLVVGDYLVFYVVREDVKTIEIHRILHGARNVRRHLS